MELFAIATAIIFIMGYCRANCNLPRTWRRQPAIRRDDRPDVFSYDNGCFFASNVYPCSCGGDLAFPLLICDKVDSQDNLERVFTHWFSRKNLGKFSLTNSIVTTMTRGLFGDKKFEYIFAKKNILTKVERGIFDGMRDSLRRIEIIHNDLLEFPFYDLSRLNMLEYLYLTYNALKNIPDSAFGYSPSLKKIKLDFNKIEYVGSNAFKDLPGLQELDIRFNKLMALNNRAFAIQKVNTGLILDLSSNKIQYVPDDAFANQSPKLFNISNNNLSKFSEKIMLPILEGMVQRNGGYIIASGNRFRCTCNDISWLVRRSITYKKHVEDLWCVNIKKELNELTLSDMGCPSPHV